NLLNLNDDPLELTGLQVRERTHDLGGSLVDLSLDVYQRHDGLLCRLEYNTDLFDEPTAERILRHFETLLTAFVLAPEAELGRHVLLSGEERRQVLTEWNDTACVVEPATVPELFERKGTRAPEDLAVVARDARLTHAEL